MTSQMEGDIALAEHRAVMAALLKDSIKRPTEDQYEQTLCLIREAMSCVITNSTTTSVSPSLSSDHF